MTNNDEMALKSRIEKALDDVTYGRACVHVPVQETDVDLVLADCLEMLAERDAYKAENLKLRQRIAELEKEEGETGRLLDRVTTKYQSSCDRIAELEARTVSVKLPEASLAEINDEIVPAWPSVTIISACEEAGINLEVGE